MEQEKELATRLKKGLQNIVNQIQEFPEVVYVAQHPNGKWARIPYVNKLGVGLACFMFKDDAKKWTDHETGMSLTLVEMNQSDAIKIAKQEKLGCLYLLSEDIHELLGHLKVS